MAGVVLTIRFRTILAMTLAAAGVAHVLVASPSAADAPRELPPASGPAPPVPTLTIT
jgi:hypothetical protein